MVKDEDIIFVTTTLKTKWLKYQSDIISNMFPNSKHIIIEGSKNWPNSWFYWIKEVSKFDCKYYVHVDEDFFFESKEEFMRCFKKIEDCEIDLLGVSDGYHHYRGANPVAINTFLLIGKIEHLINLDFTNIRFGFGESGWSNNLGLKFDNEYLKDFDYEHKKQGASNFEFEQEPYYAFLWELKKLGCKFGYLFPYFDERFKSTNPRINEDSKDIGIHMWYTREWNSNNDVWGLPNIVRYNSIEKHLKTNKII